MKKALLLCFTSLIFSGCASVTPKTVDKDFLVGEWSCTTKYEDIGVGSVDLIQLNADGSVIDDNFILDHSISKQTKKPIEDWFSSPFRYLRTNSGQWQLDGNRLTYNFKTSQTKRIIWADVFQKIQKSKFFKEYEEELFKIYSDNSHNEPIELTITDHSNNGTRKQFTTVQKMGRKTYKSVCVDKNSADYEIGERLSGIKILSEEGVEGLEKHLIKKGVRK